MWLLSSTSVVKRMVYNCEFMYIRSLLTVDLVVTMSVINASLPNTCGVFWRTRSEGLLRAAKNIHEKFVWTYHGCFFELLKKIPAVREVGWSQHEFQVVGDLGVIGSCGLGNLHHYASVVGR